MEVIKLNNITITTNGDSTRYKEAAEKFLKEAAKEKQNEKASSRNVIRSSNDGNIHEC